MPPVRVVYFGTPSFVVAPLEALVADPRFVVVAVVTQPEKPIGRDSTPRPSPVAEAARLHGIPVLTPDTLKDDHVVKALQDLQADLFVIDAYGKILPKAVLDLPHHGCVNLHPSLLPKYRGATPVPYTILGGDTETGMTVMRMSEGMDEGDILTVLPDHVFPTDDAPTLLSRLNALAAQRLGDILMEYIEGRIIPVPQDHAQATYSTLLTKDHGRIDWTVDSAVMIERKLRAFTPWPGIFTFYQGKRLKILACDALSVPSSAAPGTLIAPDRIATQDGCLRPVTVQPEGKNPMPFTDFLKGVRGEEVRFE